MVLDGMRVLLKYYDTQEENCGDVNALLVEHIHKVEVRVKELMQLRWHLTI